MTLRHMTKVMRNLSFGMLEIMKNLILSITPKCFRGLPWALRVPGRDFLVPWGCESLDTAEWVAHRYLRRLDDIKADPKFENTKGLKGTHTHLEVDEDKIRKELYKRDFPSRICRAVGNL